MMRYVVLVFLVFIVISLFSALYYVWKDRGQKSERAVKALTVRVGLSLLLFVILMLSYRFGFIADRL